MCLWLESLILLSGPKCSGTGNPDRTHTSDNWVNWGDVDCCNLIRTPELGEGRHGSRYCLRSRDGLRSYRKRSCLCFYFHQMLQSSSHYWRRSTQLSGGEPCTRCMQHWEKKIASQGPSEEVTLHKKYSAPYEATMQCFRCLRFGHTSAGCLLTERWNRCAGPHNYKDCTIKRSSTCCANCSGKHPS